MVSVPEVPKWVLAKPTQSLVRDVQDISTSNRPGDYRPGRKELLERSTTSPHVSIALATVG